MVKTDTQDTRLRGQESCQWKEARGTSGERLAEGVVVIRVYYGSMPVSNKRLPFQRYLYLIYFLHDRHTDKQKNRYTAVFVELTGFL